jgi:hypothetical protein
MKPGNELDVAGLCLFACLIRRSAPSVSSRVVSKLLYRVNGALPGTRFRGFQQARSTTGVLIARSSEGQAEVLER